jgi:signal transduction histidine kinase
MVHRIVTDSHGTIEVESAPGEGNKMTVRLSRFHEAFI